MSMKTFEGKPCKTCGRVERYVRTRRCVACSTEANVRYYAENRHKERARTQARIATIPRMLCAMRNCAKRKALAFSLTGEHLDELRSRPCFICKGSLSRVGYSIDRWDNSKGYTPENCVPMCEACNKAKRDMPVLEFLRWIERAALGIGMVYPDGSR